MITTQHRPNRIVVLLIFIALFFVSLNAPAATRTWTNTFGDGLWSTSANWSPNITPTINDTLVFPSNKTGVTTNDLLSTVRAITFDGSGYHLQGDVINLALRIDNNATTGTNYIDMPVSLNADATFTSASGGTLSLGAIDTFGHKATFSGAGTFIVNGAISGSGSVVTTGGPTLKLNATGSYTGTTTLSGGSVITGANYAIASASAVTATDTVINLNGFGWTPASLTLTGCTVTGTGTAALNVPTVVVMTSSATKATTLGTTIVLPNPGTQFHVTDGPATDDLIISGAVSGNGYLQKTGGGRLTLSGNNGNWGGKLYAQDGAVNVQNVNALGNSTGTTEITSFGILEVSGFIQGETVSFNCAGGGGVRTSGSGTWAGPVILAGDLNVYLVNGGTLTFMQSLTGPGKIASVSGVGTLDLEATSTMSATIPVDGPRLFVNGSLPNASITSLNSASTTITGSGSIGGTVNLQQGTLLPGGGPDLTLGTGPLVLRGKYLVPFGSSGTSTVVTGTVDVTGATLVFEATDAPDQPLLLIDNDGTDPVIGTFAGLPEGGLFSVDSRTFRITYTGGSGNDIVITPLSTFHVVDAIPSVHEDAGSVVINVARDSSVAGAVSVQYTTSNNTATAGSDYTATSGTLTWANGESGTKSITIPILNDSSVEADETFIVTLANPVGGAVVSPVSATVTIQDEDSKIYFSPATYSVNEGEGVVTFLIKRDAGSVAPPSSVDFSTADGTATANSDYNPLVNQTLTWQTGESFANSVFVSLTPDVELESSETFKGVLSNVQGSTLGVSTATATITDDDYTFKWAADSYSVSETAGKVTVMIERVGSIAAPVAIKYVTSDAGATAGVDYTTTSGTATWAAGDGAPKAVEVPIIDDMTLEGDEAFDLKFQIVASHGVIDNLSTRVTILDNENGVELADTTTNAAESAGTVTLNVRRTGSHGIVTVDYAAIDGTAKNGSDFTLAAGTLFWADGDTSDKSITISVINDENPESQESFQVALSNPVSASLLAKTTATVTINDDDLAGTIETASDNYAFAENCGTASVVVRRVGGSAGPASASYATSDGSAVAGSDYVAKSGTLTWAAGDSSDRTITITVNDDSEVENNESFLVNLSNVTGAGAGRTSAQVALLNDDVTSGGNAPNPGVLALSDSTLNIGETEATVTITVTRTGGSDGPATVHYATVAGTALAGSDYLATAGTIAWTAGDDTPKSFTVTILDDTITEPGEAFSVALSAATGATLGTPSSTTINITDDDFNGIISLSADPVVTGENNGSTLVFVTRTGGSTGPASVHYATANGTAIAGSDYTTATGTISWANGEGGPKAISIPIIDDTVFEPAESFTLTISNATGATLGTPVTATITINDNDPAPAGTLQFASTAFSVNENGATALITVTRTGGSGGFAGATYNTASGTAAANADFTPVAGSVTWQDGDSSPKTFTVPILEDTLAEGAETFTVSLLNVSGATLGNPSTATVTIEANDSTTSTTLSSTPNPAIVGSTITFTATVNPQSATGTISLMEGQKEIASKVLTNGSAIINVNVLALGSHSITAVYSGDSSNGGSTSPAVVQVVSGPVKSDLNRDGRSDIVLQNMTTNSVAAWLMDNKTLLEGKIVANPTAEWQVVATGDLNGDGKADIILKNKTTGAIVLWRMNGTALTSSSTIATPASTAWRVVAARDFSHDGKDDLILQNSDTGVVALWTMNDATITKGATLGTPPVTTRAVAVGSFGGDAVILQDDVTRTISRWIVSGNSVTSDQTIATPAAGWQVVAAGDMNGDGNDDLALQNSGTRTVAAWLLDGSGSVLTKTGIVATPIADWRVVGGGDYNADGRLDLLLFNTLTNGIAQWQMNGTAIGGGWNIGTLPGWKPLGN